MQFIGYAICGNIFPLCYKQIKFYLYDLLSAYYFRLHSNESNLN